MALRLTEAVLFLMVSSRVFLSSSLSSCRNSWWDVTLKTRLRSCRPSHRVLWDRGIRSESTEDQELRQNRLTHFKNRAMFLLDSSEGPSSRERVQTCGTDRGLDLLVWVSLKRPEDQENSGPQA